MTFKLDRQRPRNLSLRHVKSVALRGVSLLSLLLFWLLAARSDVIPGVAETWTFLLREAERGALLFHLSMTLRRVALAFLLAMALGTALGLAMGLSRTLDRLLEAWLLAGLSIPRIVLIVLAYLLIGLNERAVVFALALTVAPSIAVGLREGARALDRGLSEMAKLFRRPPLRVLFQVILPQLLPYTLGAARGALSLAWKMVVLAELLGRTNGVGYQISFYFQMFDLRGVLAYGLAMMIVLALLDILMRVLTEGLTLRWRRATLP